MPRLRKFHFVYLGDVCQFVVSCDEPFHLFMVLLSWGWQKDHRICTFLWRKVRFAWTLPPFVCSDLVSRVHEDIDISNAALKPVPTAESYPASAIDVSTIILSCVDELNVQPKNESPQRWRWISALPENDGCKKRSSNQFTNQHHVQFDTVISFAYSM